MSRLLLTGASGFIGKHVLRRLLQDGDFEIHAISSKEVPPCVGVVWHRVDLLDFAAAARAVQRISPTHLMHLAWYTQPGAFWHSHHNLEWVSASLELVRAFQAAGGKRLVLAGSCAEYEWTQDIYSEHSSSCHPATLYGVAKNAVQEIVTTYSRTTGLCAAWARLFFIYGPGEPVEKLASSTILALLRGHEAHCTSGEQRRDYLHVFDVADALVTLVGSQLEGPVNVASGRPLAVKDLVIEIAAQLDAPDRLRLGLMPSPTGEPASIVGDNRRLCEELGWRQRIPLTQGVAEMLTWWKARAASMVP